MFFGKVAESLIGSDLYADLGVDPMDELCYAGPIEFSYLAKATHSYYKIEQQDLNSFQRLEMVEMVLRTATVYLSG